MQAYAVLDGGGVKGAALAGGLKAAEESGIEFIGYGGTSAGSIVALLAAVGYSGRELQGVLINELDLGTILAAVRPHLNKIASLRELLRDPGLFLGWKLRSYKPLFEQLTTKFGLIDGRSLREKIFQLAKRKLPDLQEGFTFHDLDQKKCKPLKIVASDLGGRQPAIYSNAGGYELNGPVLEAVRASMSYPFIFTPIRVADRFVVDGGLCSNLPVFLFDNERKQNKRPLLAFDLVTTPPNRAGDYNLGHFCTDMLDTALEAGDYLRRRADASSNVFHIKIQVPQGIDTLDFDLKSDKLQALFNQGVADTHAFLAAELQPWQQATDRVQRLQALHAPPQDVRFLLEQFANQMEREAGMTSVRAQVMLPRGNGYRIVAYQFNMDSDPDQALELAEDAGATGRSWTKRCPVVADLEQAAKGDNYRVRWKMNQQQQAAVRKDRKAMISVPIFQPQTVGERNQAPAPELIGILSADTNASISDMMWFSEGEKLSEKGRKATLIATSWSATLSWILR